MGAPPAAATSTGATASGARQRGTPFQQLVALAGTEVADGVAGIVVGVLVAGVLALRRLMQKQEGG